MSSNQWFTDSKVSYLLVHYIFDTTPSSRHKLSCKSLLATNSWKEILVFFHYYYFSVMMRKPKEERTCFKLWKCTMIEELFITGQKAGLKFKQSLNKKVRITTISLLFIWNYYYLQIIMIIFILLFIEIKNVKDCLNADD